MKKSRVVEEISDEQMVKASEIMNYLSIGKTKLYELIAIDCFPYYNFANSVKEKPCYRFMISEVDSWRKQRSGFRR